MIQETASIAMHGDERSREDDLPSLMVRYQKGDAEAVEDLVRRLSPRLLRFLAVFEHFPSDAEDLLQDCWIRIHRSRHTYRSPEPVLPWVFAIARHTRLDGYRRRRRESREVLVANPPETVQTIRPATGGDTNEFDRLLATLPDSQREVLLTLKVSGMSWRK
jgi:RNA polymerase sigma-70 factor (ECF subfamily)